MSKTVAKYQKYADYKNIESIFLKAIPINWDIKPLYTVCDFKQGKAHEPFVDDDGEYIYVSARFVSTQGASFKQCSVNLTPAKLNDVLMVMSDLPNGRALARAFFVKEMKKYAVNQRVCAITAKRINPKFIYYQLDRSPYFLMNDDGSNQTHLSNNTFMKYPVLVPSEVEQEKIVDFLDHETTKIDRLIEKQQQLIQLLKEKRQAVISHAVTKGLDPSVKMKDSGVEWLGEVPEHWQTVPLKLCVETRKGIAFKAADFCDAGARVVKASDIKLKTIRDSDVFLPNSYLVEYPKAILYTGDLVLSTVGSTPEVKNSAVGQIGKVPESLNGSLLNQNTVVFSSKKILDQDFLFYLVQTDSYRDHLDLNAHGTANQASLNISDMLNFIICIPDLAEQLEVKFFLDNKLLKFDEMILKAESAIRLIQERRTALISAAVTGKIDVRNWQNSNNNNEAKMEFSA